MHRRRLCQYGAMQHEHPGDSIDAGRFGAWLDAFLTARDSSSGTQVPCGGCTACCRARQFVHVEAEEAETLARIPAELLFPAPGHGDGTRVMGYDASGACPMLQEGRCTIYAHRPRACRSYDCRVYAAAGIVPREPGQQEIAARALRWRFGERDQRDQSRRAAAAAAAEFLRQHAEQFPELRIGRDIDVALHAIDVHELFLNPAQRPSVDAVRARKGRQP
jgi:uncharacterized protein